MPDQTILIEVSWDGETHPGFGVVRDRLIGLMGELEENDLRNVGISSELVRAPLGTEEA